MDQTDLAKLQEYRARIDGGEELSPSNLARYQDLKEEYIRQQTGIYYLSTLCQFELFYHS
jgi:hypothetical protein